MEHDLREEHLVLILGGRFHERSEIDGLVVVGHPAAAAGLFGDLGEDVLLDELDCGLVLQERDQERVKDGSGNDWKDHGRACALCTCREVRVVDHPPVDVLVRVDSLLELKHVLDEECVQLLIG